MAKTTPPARPATKPEPGPAPDHDLPAQRPHAMPVRVRAIRDGYYGNKYRRTGDVFTLEQPTERLARWMELVDPETPEHTTSHGEALQDQRNEVMAQRQAERAGGGVLTGPDNPDDGLDPIGAREG